MKPLKSMFNKKGLLFRLVVFTIVIHLFSGCTDPRASCDLEDHFETVAFIPLEMSTTVSEIKVYMEYANFVDETCNYFTCKPGEVRWSLYGTNRLPDSEEKLLENGILNISHDPEVDLTKYHEILQLNTPPFTDFRLVIEGDTPKCTREHTNFTAQYTFSTGLAGSLEGVVYEPGIIEIGEQGTVSSPAPSKPNNGYLSPLTYEIANVTPNTGAELIDIDNSTGVITITDPLSLGAAIDYKVDVNVTDATGKSGMFANAFAFYIPDLSCMPLYTPDSMTIRSAAEMVSSVPVIPAESNAANGYDPWVPPFTFDLIGIDENHAGNTTIGVQTNSISVDPNTGVITASANLATDYVYGQGRYIVYVSISDSTGKKCADLLNKFSIIIDLSDNPQAPANLLYDPNSVTLSSQTSVQSNRPTIDGNGPFTFSIVNTNFPVTIDESTGVIHVEGSNWLEFSADSYPVSVAVSNSSGSTTFPNAFTVIISK